ncbi:thioredoxin-like protein [Kockovaella imperatae]|uniref:thioredoxin-dependent peroxiredoxin n=1 Tax=Kockovaella imperatae TaxID=4999 RepID=A0A1Y1UDF4_9TREE|nr:thioredoxin-like protein [Kockovaella imperatae]ORX35554.1 thioredoxin-like protein [Kockovaella imperatae]
MDVSELVGEKGVVFFLYPKADTPGCTNQACGYRDIHSEIAKLGYDVYGLSKDKPAAQQRWKDKKELNYNLLCDPQSKLIKRLGAFLAPDKTKRSHFIFEKGSGKLIDAQIGVKPADDSRNTLDFLKKHHK